MYVVYSLEAVNQDTVQVVLSPIFCVCVFTIMLVCVCVSLKINNPSESWPSGLSRSSFCRGQKRILVFGILESEKTEQIETCRWKGLYIF